MMLSLWCHTAGYGSQTDGMGMGMGPTALGSGRSGWRVMPIPMQEVSCHLLTDRFGDEG